MVTSERVGIGEQIGLGKRKAILDAARTEFAENGFETASYNQIIENAGLSKGAMYYYFDDKLDLYVTVLEDASQRMMKALSVEQLWPPPEGDFWGAMHTISHKAWQFALEHPELAMLFKGITALPCMARRERPGRRALRLLARADGAAAESGPARLAAELRHLGGCRDRARAQRQVDGERRGLVGLRVKEATLSSWSPPGWRDPPWRLP